jgi:hypothetical protein
MVVVWLFVLIKDCVVVEKSGYSLFDSSSSVVK